MKLTAHAYLVAGDAARVRDVCAFLEKEGIAIAGNPDVLVRTYAAFSMDDARSLRDRAALRGVGGSRLFVIAAPTIAPDAQNALLKTFEEPPAGARFILIMPSPDMLLPTLRSRMQILDLIDATASVSRIDAHIFLAATPEKRIDMLKVLLEKDDDDQRNLAGIITFLSAIEHSLAVEPVKYVAGLRALYRARQYITDRGALLKPLLEQCALLLPRVV